MTLVFVCMMQFFPEFNLYIIYLNKFINISAGSKYVKVTVQSQIVTLTDFGLRHTNSFIVQLMEPLRLIVVESRAVLQAHSQGGATASPLG